MARVQRKKRAGGRPGGSVLTVLTVCGVLAGAALTTGAAPARAVSGDQRIAPGVGYRQFDIAAAAGTAHAHLLTVDLRDPRVRLDLLHPGAVAARATVSSLADSTGAVAGINGDFFDISETQHPGVPATGANVGPSIAHGRVLKSAVPTGQRFGPSLPPGTDTREVLGVGLDRRARLDRLTLAGSVSSAHGRVPLGGLNQYALPEGSVGAYDARWGDASRLRSVCGTDTDRAAGCTTDSYEVTLRGGRVVSVSSTPGAGPIPSGTTVLVGREEGARRLRELTPGERVRVRGTLRAAAARVPYVFALGGYPVLRDGTPLAGLDDTVSAVRTAVGFSADGRRLLLLALDGGADYRRGLTVAEEAATLRGLGAYDAFNLDGGGSSELVARAPGAAAVSVRNHPSDGAERPVPNGIGVFSS